MPESSDQATSDAQPIRAPAKTNPTATFEQQMALADRLLNDPDVPLEPHKVWAILERVLRDSADEAN
jgi:hypothetical protein